MTTVIVSWVVLSFVAMGVTIFRQHRKIQRLTANADKTHYRSQQQIEDNIHLQNRVWQLEQKLDTLNEDEVRKAATETRKLLRELELEQ